MLTNQTIVRRFSLFFVLVVLANLILIGTGLYVIGHFIAKFW